MVIKNINEETIHAYKEIANHPLQSFEWGKFREKTGVKVIRKGVFGKEKIVDGFQLTIHKIPRTNFTIGYLPKGSLPDKDTIEELKKIGLEERCVFIQFEPDVIQNIYKNGKGTLTDAPQEISLSARKDMLKRGFVDSAHPLFTKYTFVLDIRKSEEELLENMHAKWRYNIRVAQKHGVEVVEDNSNNAFREYTRLTHETTTRQKFYAHTDSYHKKQWDTLPHKAAENSLSSHLLLAKYNDKVLTAWIVFVFKDKLYYPYGASSNEHRETMSSNLMMWEVIRFGKKMNLTKFDMWGALGPHPDTKDSWYGFHRFKLGYGGELVEFVGSYDLVINPPLYQLYKLADKARWLYLRLKK